MCVNTKSEPEDEAEEGLGGLPSNISSISSLLLFNTTENLYGEEKAGGKEGGKPCLGSFGDLNLVQSSGLDWASKSGYPKGEMLPQCSRRGGQGSPWPQVGIAS